MFSLLKACPCLPLIIMAEACPVSSKHEGSVVLLLHLGFNPSSPAAVCADLMLTMMLLLSYLVSEPFTSAVVCADLTLAMILLSGISGFRAIYICCCVCRPDAGHDTSQRDHGIGAPHCAPATCLSWHHSPRSHAHRYIGISKKRLLTCFLTCLLKC